ncbi:hypothetical protein RRG08_033153 [Elysia crispata]|uniref:Uncharacterized protein n=1 Tax=Elysia crispata TaxID=231223 RepID=A0AAE1D750_9GAST|nr:hypothetical protein RRG08_033153 [Elysia crispata]
MIVSNSTLPSSGKRHDARTSLLCSRSCQDVEFPRCLDVVFEGSRSETPSYPVEMITLHAEFWDASILRKLPVIVESCWTAKPFSALADLCGLLQKWAMAEGNAAWDGMLLRV